MGPHLPAGLIGWVFLTKRYVFARTRAYLRYGEPEGEKPSALYQNPATISRFEKHEGPWARGLWPGALGPGPWAPGHGPRAMGPGPWGPSNRHIRQAIDTLDKI